MRKATTSGAVEQAATAGMPTGGGSVDSVTWVHWLSPIDELVSGRQTHRPPRDDWRCGALRCFPEGNGGFIATDPLRPRHVPREALEVRNPAIAAHDANDARTPLWTRQLEDVGPRGERHAGLWRSRVPVSRLIFSPATVSCAAFIKMPVRSFEAVARWLMLRSKTSVNS